MEILPKLYSRNFAGKIIEWQIRVCRDEDSSTIVTLFGLFKGNLASSTRIVSEGKNIGKSNETDHYQQAIKEAYSDWKHKRKEGYKSLEDLHIHIDDDGTITYNKEVYDTDFENVLDMALPIDKTDPNENLKPMKCQPFRRGKMKYPCIAQPKINGGRCVARYEFNQAKDLFEPTDYIWKLRSKEGDLLSVKHISDALTKMTCLPFDGEVYRQKTPVTTINGAARNPNNPINSQLMFWIFDLSLKDLDQKTRIGAIEHLPNFDLPFAYVDLDGRHNHYELNAQQHPIVVIKSVWLYSDDEAEAYRTACINAGYEGCVIRDADATYKFGSRPITMMKLKTHIDAEFLCVNIIAQDKRPELPMFVFKNDINDLQFESTPTGTHEEQREMLINKGDYIGKHLTVRYRERINTLPFHTNVIF